MITAPQEYLFLVNALLVILFMIVLYRGYKRGLILQVLDLVSIGVSLLIAWLFAPVLVRVFNFVTIAPTTLSAIDQSINHSLNQLIWFGIIFIVVRIVLMVVTPIATLISKMPLIKQVNSITGGVFSIVTYAVYVTLIIVFLSFPIVKNGQQVIDGTLLNPLQKVSAPVLSIVHAEIEKNTALQSILSERKLSQEQEDQLVAWLQSQGFSQSAIEEFLKQYE